ncbi:Uncharacterised protein [Mycobacteroides abscessus subsp. massiliense]|nr:hypothetical protein [Mycobacteroides abscessus]SKK75333.1 Uncharacterised protein [Mycobacteroides abscessus subsp. massiliense]SKL00726.1 Uncharacterised protein [Mycobacteroides abscessus subsp. massiliense]SKM11208.1 Uncharacterised protein [Mycobacteroides abscessus subsp. massiliense]
MSTDTVTVSRSDLHQGAIMVRQGRHILRLTEHDYEALKQQADALFKASQ